MPSLPFSGITWEIWVVGLEDDATSGETLPACIRPACHAVVFSFGGCFQQIPCHHHHLGLLPTACIFPRFWVGQGSGFLGTGTDSHACHVLPCLPACLLQTGATPPGTLPPPPNSAFLENSSAPPNHLLHMLPGTCHPSQ